MLDADLAYIAGFFDGEGCVGIYPVNRRTGYQLLVQIAQNESTVTRALFTEIHARWGGNIAYVPSLSGRIKMNYAVRSTNAATLLVDLLPYLRGKADQAWIAAAWQTQRTMPDRGPDGRYPAVTDDQRALADAAYKAVRLLKKQDMEQMMMEHPDLVAPLHTLSQILNYKGV